MYNIRYPLKIALRSPIMRTRSTAPAEQPDPEQRPQLPPSTKPCKTFILPSAATDDARLIQLPNPRTGELARYFFCPKLGVYEFTVVKAPSHDPRSVLFTQKSEEGALKGSISKAAELLVATPIDIMFFLIPLLCPSSSTQSKGLFQPLDDIIDSQDEFPGHLQHVLYNETFRGALQARAEAICDSVEAGDEKMLRFSETKLLKELLTKADRMVAQGLPASLEERFIKQALATPLLSVKREDVGPNGSSEATDGEAELQEGKDSASATNTTSTPSVSTPSGESASTPATEAPTEESAIPDNITHLLRVSTALTFMKESYIAQDLGARLDELLASADSPLDFKPLKDRLEHLAKLRAEALASRSLGDFSRKRNLEDEDAAESRAEKKRRKEAEEKKKKAEQSRGVRELKKVDTSGMKKMSDFFGKAAAKKKS